MKPARIVPALESVDVVWEGMSYEQWSAQAPKLGKLVRGVQWLVGAWILHGERFGERYAQAVAETGLATQTVLNILSVMKAFPDPARRRAALSFAHHEAVAALKDARDQDRWLDAAERQGWSVTRLRAELRKGARPRAVREEVCCKTLVAHAWRVRSGALPHCPSCSCGENPTKDGHPPDAGVGK